MTRLDWLITKHDVSIPKYSHNAHKYTQFNKHIYVDINTSVGVLRQYSISMVDYFDIFVFNRNKADMTSNLCFLIRKYNNMTEIQYFSNQLRLKNLLYDIFNPSQLTSLLAKMKMRYNLEPPMLHRGPIMNT